MNPIKEIKRFQEDRLLNKQKFNETTAIANILEEVLELQGFNVPKSKRKALSEEWSKFVEESLITKGIIEYDELEEHYKEDALCDIIVFSIGELMKLNQDPTEALMETAKEINSRMQEPRQRDEWKRLGSSGKFQKWRDQPKETLYKANYNTSKLSIKNEFESFRLFRRLLKLGQIK